MRRLYRCCLDLPPDPTRLARSISGQTGSFLLRSTARRKLAILGAWPLEHRSSIWPESEWVKDKLDGESRPLPRWIGILPYEAFRGLERGRERKDKRTPPLFDRCEWWRYGAVALVQDGVEVVGDSALAVERLAQALGVNRAAEPVRLRYRGVSEPDSMHAARVDCLLKAIARGGLYQANLARCFRFEAHGSALGLYERLFEQSSVPFGFALDAGKDRTIVGASPELCLEIRADGSLLTRPIKGTRPRGGSRSEDTAQIEDLSRDPKELAELNMVIDLERNDLGRIAQTGTVIVLSAGEVESYEAVHHRVATVRACLRSDVGPCQALAAFLPSGSVTGAPKVAAMQAIGELETERRGLYTGAVGYVAYDGSLHLAMAIRTLVVDAAGQAKYHSGGGIVADSIPEREVRETRWKAQQLLTAAAPTDLSPGGFDCHPNGRDNAKNWADWMGSCIEG